MWTRTRKTRLIGLLRLGRVQKAWGLLEKGLFRKIHFVEISRESGILETLENPQTVENKAESGHFLEILEKLEILKILESPPVKRLLFVMTPFSGPQIGDLH